jgi:hypothetical protein
MINRWVEVKKDQYPCYGQLDDVGPFREDDVGYVFGSNPHPQNTEGLSAGLDVSPAMRDCLHFSDGSAQTTWRIVSEDKVPSGPWTKKTTSSY